MPVRAPRVCSCGKVVASGQRCACRRASAKAHDAERGTAAQRGYGARWQRESKAFLAEPGHERCACGCGRLADMVDHIRAPKGDQALFWMRSNWQPFARICNTRKAITTEGGFGRSTRSAAP
jgi:5-methylcytosine-specific restriction protein A